MVYKNIKNPILLKRKDSEYVKVRCDCAIMRDESSLADLALSQLHFILS